MKIVKDTVHSFRANCAAQKTLMCAFCCTFFTVALLADNGHAETDDGQYTYAAGFKSQAKLNSVVVMSDDPGFLEHIRVVEEKEKESKRLDAIKANNVSLLNREPTYHRIELRAPVLSDAKKNTSLMFVFENTTKNIDGVGAQPSTSSSVLSHTLADERLMSERERQVEILRQTASRKKK